MTVLCDFQIAQMSMETNLISPFTPGQVNSKTRGKPTISYGLSSCGYDVRLGYEFMVPKPNPFVEIDIPSDRYVIDPKDLDENLFERIRCNDDDGFLIRPHGFCLGTTIETIKMPNDVVGKCVGKSTYARCGILITPTPLEPGWRGELTIEITNVTDYPAIIYPGEGICQIVFYLLDKDPQVTYADRKGKYQDQKGITPAKV